MTPFAALRLRATLVAPTPTGAWNPSDSIGPTLTYTESNALATGGGGTESEVRGTTSHSSGKFYFEVEFVSGTSGSTGIHCGIIGSASPLKTVWTSLTDQVSYRANGQLFKNGTSFIGSYAVYGAGSVIGFAVDLGAKTCAVFMNNALQASISFTPSAVSPLLIAGASLSARLRTTAAGLIYSPPSGFSSWD